MGKKINLDLSLGLFSSNGIDMGSILLLKSIAGQCDLSHVHNVLDAGCGCGALGLAIASYNSEARVNLIDRDRLAVEFSAHNARLNRLDNVIINHRLMLENGHPNACDLIVSNFPAKAGLPVIEDFILRAPGLLSTDGRVCLVIVQPLADACRNFIHRARNIILHEEWTKSHTVFHFRGKSDKGAEQCFKKDWLQPYIRHPRIFAVGRARYTLETAWNIGDFDSISWRIELLAGLLEKGGEAGGRWVFWSPGQGHFPLLCTMRPGATPGEIVLAGRDRLALLISERNLKAYNSLLKTVLMPLTETGMLSTKLETDSVNLLLTDLAPIPRSAWSSRLKQVSAQLIKPGGKWAITGRSAHLAELLKNTRYWTMIGDRRHHGWRAVILRRNS